MIVGKQGVRIACPGVVCEGKQAEYIITEPIEGCVYTWSAAGGRIVGATTGLAATVDWTTYPTMSPDDGFGYITATPSGCSTCYEPTTMRIPIIRPTFPITGAAKICGDSQQRYSMPQWPTTEFEWTILNTLLIPAEIIHTDQRNEIIIDPHGYVGDIYLEVVYQNTLLHCGGRSTLTIKVLPDAEINGPTEVCLGSSGTYTLANGLSANWKLWKLPNGTTTNYTGASFTPSAFPSAGTYGLTVTSTSFCSAKTFFIDVNSHPAPVDTDVIGSRIVCPSAPSVFSIANSVPGTIIGWSIPPGVGTIVGSNYGNEVQIIFNHPITGDYSISVWREGIDDPICKSPDLLIPLELVPFDLVQITGLDYVCGSSYQDYSVVEADGELYEWSLLDPDKGSIVINGSREVKVLWNQFATLQTTHLKIKVTKCNITEEKIMVVTIADPTITLTGPTEDICQDTNVNFTINTTPLLTSGTITWDFGDGTIREGLLSENHTYTNEVAAPTTYTVKVTVHLPNECRSTIVATTTVTVMPLPKASMSPTTIDLCQEVTFPVALTVTPEPGQGTITIVGWIKDGDPISNPNSNPFVFNVPDASGAGHYSAIISNGTCERKIDEMFIMPCPTCTPPTMTLALVRDCEQVTATGSYSAPPVADTEGFYSSILATSVVGHVGTFHFVTPGVKTIKYALIFDDCRVEKSQDILIPYIVKLGVEVSCGSGNQYSVKLVDRSLYASGVTANFWEFKVNGVTQPKAGLDNDNDRTMLLDGDETYTFSLTIHGDGSMFNDTFEYCTDEIEFPLRKVPDPSFTFTPTPDVCQYTATKFTVDDQNQGDVTYYWDFDDGSYNLQQNPEREYFYGLKYPRLTVTDRYGCSRTSATGIEVNVLQNDQSGTIDPPTISCPGGSVPLHVEENSGSMAITSIQWLLNNELLSGATGNDYPATVSGQYSAIIGNANGCTHQIAQSVPVAIATPPIAAIQGPSVSCLHEPVRLFVSPGQGNSYTYNWYRSDQPEVSLSTTQELVDTPPDLNTYTYSLEVTFTLANGAPCTYTLAHDVTVQRIPEFIEVTGTVTSCAPYTVVLKASVDLEGGVYNWSDGQTGNLVTENQGGIYQVTYTAPGGCKIYRDVTVPKNPENFIWIFPNGCYEMCLPLDTASLIGPDVVQFQDWQWHEMSGMVAQGDENMEPHGLTATDNIYFASLTTGSPDNSCTLISQKMKVTALDCKDCKIEAYIIETGEAIAPYFHYVITIHIDNSSSDPMPVQLSVPNNVGVITPGSIVVPPGGGNYTIWLVSDPSYQGALTKLTLRSDDGKPCIGEENIEFDDSSSSRLMQPAKDVTMTLSPNPAKEKSQLIYDFGDESLEGNPELIVYDLFGRVLQREAPSQKQGVWQISSGQYASGNYVVVMKCNGKILGQKILVVID